MKINISEINKTVVVNLRRIITEKNIKKKIIANQIGVSATEFSAMLNGRKLITVEHICKLLDALQVEANELFRRN